MEENAIGAAATAGLPRDSHGGHSGGRRGERGGRRGRARARSHVRERDKISADMINGTVIK